MKVAQSCLTFCHSMDCPWDSLGQNTGVGSLSLLQGFFLTQESNRGLLHCRWILYQLIYEGNPRGCPPQIAQEFLLPVLLLRLDLRLEKSRRLRRSVHKDVSVCSHSLSHVRLFCDPMDCSPPGYSVCGILQARILEWVAMPSFRASSQPRN